MSAAASHTVSFIPARSQKTTAQKMAGLKRTGTWLLGWDHAFAISTANEQTEPPIRLGLGVAKTETMDLQGPFADVIHEMTDISRGGPLHFL